MGTVIQFPVRPAALAPIDSAIPGQAITIFEPHRKFGTAYAEFVAHVDGQHILVRKLISGMWKARWTKPLMVERAAVLKVHASMARAAS